MSDGGDFCEDSDEVVIPYDGWAKKITDTNSQITDSMGMLPPPNPSKFEPIRTDRLGQANMDSGLMPHLYVGMLLQVSAINTAEIKMRQQEFS